jgi:polysaccharide export outer membrane protein
VVNTEVPNPNAPDTNVTSSAFTNLDNIRRLSAGDRVSYRVIEDKEEAKSLVVADSGELEIPYYGRIVATNKTCQTLALELKHLLEKDLYYTATVIMAVDQLNPKRGTVYLVGQVRASGPVLMPSDDPLTLSKAILKAGGFAEFADKKRVRVTRRAGGPGGQIEVFTVNVTDIIEKGRSDKDMRLEPDDLIYVPERRVNF